MNTPTPNTNEAKQPPSEGCMARLVVPSWAYEKPKYDGAATRITPLSGKFRDADWIEPRESLTNDPDGQKTYAVSANGGIRILNSTPLRVFETEGYVRWTFNPTKHPLVKRFFNIFKPFPYWTPFIFRHNAQAMAPRE